MLTLLEKILFFLGVLVSIYFAYRIAIRIVRILRRGHGQPDFRSIWTTARRRFASVLGQIIILQPTFRIRRSTSLLHAFIAWCFIYYLLVNVVDLIEAYIHDFTFLGNSILGNYYRLFGDLLSVAALVAMATLLLRRFIFRSPLLQARQDVLLHPRARSGIQRDSAIVGVFVLVHIGWRFLGQSFLIALEEPDPWQPFADSISRLWTGISPLTMQVGIHLAFWLSLGAVLVFIPYFLYSKHIHLIFAPLNLLLKPERRSIGELSSLDFEDESIEHFGASRLEDLGWEQIMDAFACIMCYRCQQVCPAYNTGKVLSPAALEINKRYFLNSEGARLAQGQQSSQTLTEFAIPYEAIWACTACGACINICPVGNEPMRDILDIRRDLALMENHFPKQLETAFRGMERTVNPWGVPPSERLKWAEGLHVVTIEENPEPEILWWVGCAPSTDIRAQKTARAFTQILTAADVNYAVLGENEHCTGDSARRAGKEDLFFSLATTNIEILNEIAHRKDGCTQPHASARIVTTCPHCLHTLKNEYPAYGGSYEVIHHSQLIDELVTSGRLKLKAGGFLKVTYHDPCYLGRHNQLVAAPRASLEYTGAELLEMPRRGMQSFCCGAGGAQMWKEEEHGNERINANRYREALATGADALVVACPFCMIMLSDAAKNAKRNLPLLDVAEVVVQQMEA
jgi:Fe-S oxidoreductase